MNLRHLAFLVALAREQHFGRAARTCHVTQPTLSEAIRGLEDSLGAPLVVRRAQRFESLTPEGLRVVDWARRILADVASLRQSLGELRATLEGELRLGAIPTVEPLIATLTGAFADRHPAVTVSVQSLTADEIVRGLAEHTLDAGFSYVTDAPGGLRTYPLYAETYTLVGAPALLPARRSITWARAAAYPLCLLTRDMQNRRLIDGHFAAAGARPEVLAESDSLLGVLSHVRSGRWCAILPRAVLPFVPGLRSLPLREPEIAHPVGLLVAAREPAGALARALLEVARQVRLGET